MLKLACGEKVKDSFYSGQCRERIEAVLKNLCMVSSNDEKAAGELLFAVRFKKGMSQSEIARAEGVSRQAVSKRIKQDVFLTRLQKIMKIQKKQKRAHRKKLIYDLYMSGTKYVEIEKKTGCKYPSTIAQNYAKKHKLPFEFRDPRRNNRREKK